MTPSALNLKQNYKDFSHWQAETHTIFAQPLNFPPDGNAQPTAVGVEELPFNIFTDHPRNALERQGMRITDETVDEWYRRKNTERRYSLGDEPETFDERREAAIKNRGTVMPGLNEAEVNIVNLPRHNYTGRNVPSQAVDAAKARYKKKRVR